MPHRRVLASLLLLSGLATSALAGPSDQWKRAWPRTDFSKSSIDLSQVRSGGPSKDGIPAIDEPRFAAVGKVDLADREPVISVFLGGEARAYPLRILMWHEIVNDRVAGVPIAVTFCPLCNASVVFERTVGGRELDFGTTGKLRYSDLIMYDRPTESWWQQFTGEAIVGVLEGTRLTPVASRIESFARFRERAPEGQVLLPDGGARRSYGENPYRGYDRRKRPYDFMDGPFPAEIAPLARVVRVGEQAWALALLRESKRIESGDLILTWQAGQASALDTKRIAEGRDVGNVVVQRRTPGGLVDVPHGVDFAFAFHAFHPDAPIHVMLDESQLP